MPTAAPSWIEDAEFVLVARVCWGGDLGRAVAAAGRYCGGADQRLVLRWQGWVAARSMEAE